MNKTYRIGKNAGYDGCGLCLAAISENEAIKLKYLRDICPDYDLSLIHISEPTRPY